MSRQLFKKNNKSAGGKISIQILKESEFTFETLTNCINKAVEIGYFPDSLKKAYITPIFKKDDPHDKSNYRLSLHSTFNFKSVL